MPLQIRNFQELISAALCPGQRFVGTHSSEGGEATGWALPRKITQLPPALKGEKEASSLLSYKTFLMDLDIYI